MLNDGYGEQLSHEQVEDIIDQKERLLRIIVSERTTDYALLNEGRITIWEVLQKRPDAPSPYLTAAMKQRVIEVLSRGKFTGMPSQRGKPSVDPLRRSDRDSFDDPDFGAEFAAADSLDTVLLAYHEGEILRAINELPQKHKEYVILRFWGGYTNTEIAAIQNVKAGNMARTWTEVIRPRLEEALSHLIDL